jgi:uracil-DNA glycosylase
MTGQARGAATASAFCQPRSNCRLCPRLLAFRQENRESHPDFFNAPVPSFGSLDARLLIVGLAPGLKGANRTGRPFTGDYAGELLYGSLQRHGLVRGEYQARSDDGLALRGVRIANSVRCVPPANKPLPAEIATCRPFLLAEIEAMPRLQAILTLGQIAHDSVLKAFALRKKDHPFQHGAHYRHGSFALIGSYHCSRYNTNTGVLTQAMFDSVMAAAKRAADL